MARHLDVVEHAVFDIEVDDDLVAAERVETLDPVRGRGGQLTAVTRGAVVIEDDFAVEVFEVGQVIYPNILSACSSASISTSCRRAVE